jgi:hypothetical protein
VHVSLSIVIKENVSSYAVATITEYMDDIGRTGKNDVGSCSWIISRIVGLVEMLPVLLQGGKKVEVRLELQKVTGYLKCAEGIMKSVGSSLTASVSFRRSLIRKYSLYATMTVFCFKLRGSQNGPLCFVFLIYHLLVRYHGY